MKEDKEDKKDKEDNKQQVFNSCSTLTWFRSIGLKPTTVRGRSQRCRGFEWCC